MAINNETYLKQRISEARQQIADGHVICADSDYYEKKRQKIIKDGILAGLVDAKAGRGHELTDSYVSELISEIKKRIANKKAI